MLQQSARVKSVHQRKRIQEPPLNCSNGKNIKGMVQSQMKGRNIEEKLKEYQHSLKEMNLVEGIILKADDRQMLEELRMEHIVNGNDCERHRQNHAAA